jgi:hypothetical protein
MVFAVSRYYFPKQYELIGYCNGDIAFAMREKQFLNILCVNFMLQSILIQPGNVVEIILNGT